LGTNHSHPDVFWRNAGPFARHRRLVEVIAHRIISLYYNRCDLVSSGSSFLNTVMAGCGVRRRSIITPNIVDTSIFFPQPRPPSALSSAPSRRIVYFGRLSPDKNLPRLIRLVRPVLLEFAPHLALDIIGDGPEREGLAVEARERGLGASVRLVGRLDGAALGQAIAHSEICVNASLTENQSMSLLESLACGVPVVALRAGGVPEIVEDGYNGFVVDDGPAASQEFPARLRRLLIDHDLRQRMAINAHRFARRRTAACLQATLAAYAQTIRAASARLGARASHSGSDSQCWRR
jgi:glycosyltransferase involved in cell wall biosynthesis